MAGDEIEPTSVSVSWGGVSVTARGRRNARVYEWQVDTLALSPGQQQTVAVTVCNQMDQCSTQSRLVTQWWSPTPILSVTAMPFEALGRTAGAPLGGGFAIQGAEVVTGLGVPGYVSWDQGRGTGLTYSSRQSYPRALVNADLEFPGGLPTSLTVKLWDGAVVMSQFTQANPGCSSGGQPRCRVSLAASYLGSTGTQVARKWLRLEVQATINGGVYTSVDSVEAVIVDRRTTPYGSGWWPSGVLRVAQVGDDAVIVGSDGTATLYRGYQDQYLSPPGDWSTLTKTAGGWELVFRTGERLIFDTQGRQIESRGLNTLWRTLISWSGTDQVDRITDPAGKYFQFTYTAGKLSAISDVSGRTNPITISSGQLTRFIPANAGTQYRRDFVWAAYTNGAVLPRYAADAQDRRDSLVYSGDWPQRVILPQVQNDSGANVRPDLWYFAPELKGLNATVSLDSVYARAVDARGNWTHSTINRWGQPLRTWDALGTLAVATYSRTGLPLTVEGKFGDSTRVFHVYDALDRRISSYRLHGSTPVRLDSLVWNGAHRVTRQYGMLNGQVVDYVYNAWGSVTSAVSSVGDTTLNTYNATTGRLETVHTSGVTGVRRVWYEGTWGNTDSVQAPDGATVARNFYDVLGRQRESWSRITVRATSATTELQWRRRILSYTTLGQVDTVHVEQTANCAAPCTTPTWPEYDHPKRTRTRITTFDEAGRPIALLMGLTGVELERRVYDALGRLVARGRPTSTGALAWDSLRYDRAGNLRFTRTRRGHLLETRYDSRNRPVWRDIPTVGTDTLVYLGPNDELTAITVSGFQDPVGGSNPNARWVYDQVGRLRSDTVQGNRWTRYTYDALDRPDSIVDPLGGWRTRYHATRGTADSLLTPFGDQVSYLTDAMGRRNGPNVLTNQGWTFQRGQVWFSGGGLNQLVNTVAGTGAFVAGRHYLKDEEIIYARDSLAPRWDEAQSASGPSHTGTDSLQYDGWERVTQALQLRDGVVQRAQAYRFDNAGNLTVDSVLGTSETWTFATAGQQLLTARGCTFTYDAAGNLTQRACPGATTTYTYDALDRLTNVSLPGGGTVAYTYDVLGQRIAKKVNGVITRFVWCGGHVLYETTGAGTITRSYTWGMGTDDLVAIHDHEASKHYYVVQDQLRTVRALIERTGSSGTWRAAWRYTPYGELLSAEGSVSFPVRFRWAGAQFDEETGLYFLRTRSYDPRFGRFIQADVAGFAGGENLYAYAGGDPTSGRDPSGLISVPEPQYRGDPEGGWQGALDPFAGSGGGLGSWHRGEGFDGWGSSDFLTQFERDETYKAYLNGFSARINENSDFRNRIRALTNPEFWRAYDAVMAEVPAHFATERQGLDLAFQNGAYGVDVGMTGALRTGVDPANPYRRGTVYANYRAGGTTGIAWVNSWVVEAGRPTWLVAAVFVHEYLHLAEALLDGRRLDCRVELLVPNSTGRLRPCR